MKKKNLIPIIIIAVILLVFVYCKFGLKIGSRHFDTYEEYTANAPVRGERIGLPEGAEDAEFFYKNSGIGYSSMYAFTLKGNNYQQFINGLVREHNLDVDEAASHGYSRWYGMTVAESLTIDYELDRFPVNLPFDEVIHDDIKNYEIILYSPMGTGTSGSGIVANPNTGRIVVYCQGSIR